MKQIATAFFLKIDVLLYLFQLAQVSDLTEDIMK